jgi:DNA (cytosine-5)-methyltransferase 1
MQQLVLSLFPGIGLLDMAFEQEGFCVVQSRDWIMGGDVRNAHFPHGKFDGVIGGPPCQAFSRLANMVRQNGYEPKFGNLIPEFERVINETRPQWFLMEEVPDAPRPKVAGYEQHEFTINNRQCFDESGAPAVQNRVRAITFGYQGERRPLMIETAVFHNQRYEYAACGGSSGSSLGAAGWDGGVNKKSTRQRNPGVVVKIGGSGKVKSTLNKCVGSNIKSRSSLARLCELQGLPDDFAERLSFTVTAACKAVGNGVPLPMGRAIAKAVKEATACGPEE